jgi:hypothetical protein
VGPDVLYRPGSAGEDDGRLGHWLGRGRHLANKASGIAPAAVARR